MNPHAIADLPAGCRPARAPRPSPLVLALLAALGLASAGRAEPASGLTAAFQDPPDSARPWVYWYFMDGNLTKEGMTADLEAMKRVGLGGGIFLEVNVGVPRGPVDFMSEAWRDLFRHAASETGRLGLQLALGAGPGWCGAGGPWVAPEQSMQHLVGAETNARGPARFEAVLPQPPPRAPFFGERTLTPELRKQWMDFYRDVAVLAFPTPEGDARIADLDEKALYRRAPYSSQPGVKPLLPAPAAFPSLPPGRCIARGSIVDLTQRLSPDGRLVWDVPPGAWTIVRFGRTSTGQCTRPAPQPGLGFECDKFSRAALDAHFAAFGGALLEAVGPRRNPGAGITTLHFDSWEMSSQNWSAAFREDFLRRRGYDPLRFLPVMAGRVVDSLEVSERFLWDLRQTAQELVIENHAVRLKELGRRHGLEFSVEPYDMNPCADLALGAPADVPQCEFWARGHGFKTAYSVIEASSIAHTLGRPVVAAESFTSAPGEDWRLYPGAMKAQTDWALCAGINRIIFHTFQHQPWLDRWPGMAMGPYGVHWQRTQTWWEMSGAYHRYIARCQHLLRQGDPVADVLYLAAEGAPHVFRPPPSALAGDDVMPDRRGYNFDGCDPAALAARAGVRDDGCIALRRPAGEAGCDSPAYRMLVLPDCETMTPGLLARVKALVEAGATVLGPRPLRSPGLSGHPACDDEVRRLAADLWGPEGSNASAERRVGKGTVIPVPHAAPTQAEAAPGRVPGRAAQWIWADEGDPARSAPRCTRHFRRAFVVADGAAVKSAWLTLTADNSYEARVNGRTVGRGDSFHVAGSFDVAARLRPGTNLLTVAAVNGGDTDNPAGLIATLELTLPDGTTRTIHTDAAWEAAPAAKGPWAAARALGPLGMAPWGAVNPAPPADEFASLYPDYDVTARVLAARGVPPDFESDRPMRYIHRRTADADLYFVSNPDAAPVDAACRFRATSRRAAALWDPMTGRISAHAAAQEPDGRLRVDLAMESQGAVFVVFTDKPDPAAAPGVAAPAGLRNVLTLAGPWDVSFQPGRGAPASARFAELSPWNEHADDGIRHFSGAATYRMQFRHAAAGGTAPRTFLDLGRVEVMARAKLNGRDLGVAWVPPYRLEITSELRNGDNELEIEVANLWPNRLIGDQALPADKRITWTTWNPYKKDDPLLPSGLLGPVTLMAQE